MNWIVGWFGYEWVLDSRPRPVEDESDPISDEGWEDVHAHSPRYRLQKRAHTGAEH
ncbi:hypothetical protein [Thiomicrospira sp. WB1]|uniref:hypothetical protein n=1 Tax=Thiomicrospira sp. WB1 TaxID=1685380 RepID=UPI001365CE79|nr:hypothetical protein [Thiomicrospira sp. WB1]